MSEAFAPCRFCTSQALTAEHFRSKAAEAEAENTRLREENAALKARLKKSTKHPARAA